MQMIKVGRQWGMYSWADGIKLPRGRTLTWEARMYPEAVINRLMRAGLWEEAEEVMDKYMKGGGSG